MSRTQYIITNSIIYQIARDWCWIGVPLDDLKTCRDMQSQTLCHKLNILSRTLSSIKSLGIGVPLDWLEICKDMRTRLLCHELNISSRTLSPIISHGIGVQLDYLQIFGYMWYGLYVTNSIYHHEPYHLSYHMRLVFRSIMYI